MMRLVTAREQVEMLSPWREAAVNLFERDKVRKKLKEKKPLEPQPPPKEKKHKHFRDPAQEWYWPTVAKIAGPTNYDEYGNPVKYDQNYDDFQNENPHNLGGGLDLHKVHGQWKKWLNDDDDDYSISHWGNVEEFLNDNGVPYHGAFDHPLSVAMQQLHGLSQGRTWRLTPQELRDYQDLIREQDEGDE